MHGGKRFPLESDNHAFNYVLENHPFIVDIAKSYLSSNNENKTGKRKNKLKHCKSCGRKLVAIDNDWSGREYHKNAGKNFKLIVTVESFMSLVDILLKPYDIKYLVKKLNCIYM